MKLKVTEFSLRLQIKIYFGLVILGLGYVFWLIHENNSYVSDTAKRVEHTDQVLLKISKIISYAQDLESGTRGYLLTGKETYLSYFSKAVSELPSAIANLKRATSDKFSQERIDVIAGIIQQNILHRIDVINARKQQGFDTANAIFQTGIGKALMDKLRAEFTKIEAEERRLLTKSKIANDNSVERLTRLIVFVEFLILSLFLLGFFIIYRNVSRRIKAEAQLEKSNHFIQGLINNTTNPITIRDLSGKYLLANKPLHDTLNLPDEDLIGKSCYDVLPEQTSADLRNADKELITTRKKIEREYTLPLPDGVHYYSSCAFPLYDERDKLYAIGSVYTDITPMKKAEATLTTSNSQMQSFLNRMERLMNTANDVICVINEEGRFTQVSSSCKRLLGYTPSELVGVKYIDLVHPDDVEKTNETAAQVMAGKSCKNFENHYYRKDGTSVPVSWVATWSPEDRHLYCVARDATEKKQTLEQLKKIEDSLERAQKIARLGSWEVNLASRQMYCSKQFLALTGRSKEEMGNSITHFLKIVHPDDITLAKRALQTALQQTRSWDVQFRVIKPNGRVICVDSKGEVTFKSGQAILVKGTLQDITERKKYEQERELMISELVKANADLKQFTFITSHNLRAPISNIISITKLINPESLNVFHKQLFDMLTISTKQLDDTIQDLTRIMLVKNNETLAVEKIKVPAMFDEVMQAFEHPLHQAGGSIHTDFQVRRISFNVAYFESILVNLISNAIKFRSHDRPLQIDVATKLNHDGAPTLVVSDNGSGIDMTMHKNSVFGLYQRFHEKVEGRGLGLFLIKSQITAMGAFIEVESEVDKGTVFTVTFKS